MSNKESSNIPAVNFLGRVMREQPEILDDLSPRDRYILFSHSDQYNNRTFRELGELFGFKAQNVNKIYKRTMEQTFRRTAPHIQKLTPLNIIFESSPYRTEAMKRRWKDPEQKELFKRNLGKLHNVARGKERSPETRRRISETLKARIIKLSLSHRIKLSEAMKKRWEDPEQRPLMQKHLRELQRACKGKECSPETRRRISETKRAKKSKNQSRIHIDPSDQELWEYVSLNGLAKNLGHYFTDDEMASLSMYFSHLSKPKKIEELLDRLSLTLARLA